MKKLIIKLIKVFIYFEEEKVPIKKDPVKHIFAEYLSSVRGINSFARKKCIACTYSLYMPHTYVHTNMCARAFNTCIYSTL